MTRFIVDIHIIQTVPPANLNRDDTGSPKSARFGGTRRARVSSQAWKRATRVAFEQSLPPEDTAIRTRRLLELLAAELAASGFNAAHAPVIAEGLLAGLNLSVKGDQRLSEYLLFLGRRQIAALIAAADVNRDALTRLTKPTEVAAVVSKEALRDCLSGAQPVDVALFGRMIADTPDLNIDAACQVAHALSTHAVDIEFDYFTAVDDLSQEPGAGMIGTVEFNAATLYRYAAVDVDQLRHNLGDDAHVGRALNAFLTAFVTSMPGGHQNSFAHRTLPDFCLFAVRSDQPVNLAIAFEEAVRSTPETGVAAESVHRLADTFTATVDLYGQPPSHLAATYLPWFAPHASKAFGAALPLDQAVTETVNACTQGTT
jgi:CRISPR system Cascade subunit CasC